jgi:hypothetical protein
MPPAPITVTAPQLRDQVLEIGKLDLRGRALGPGD